MFVALLSQSGQLPVLALDELVAQAVQSTRSPMGDGIFGAITSLGNGAFIWMAVAMWSLGRGYARRAQPEGRTMMSRAAGLLAALAVSQVLVEWIIKPLTLRSRPLMVHPDWNYLGLTTTTTSFPSGHTSWAFCAVPLLWAIDRRVGMGALAFAMVMGFSRIYVSAHWATDVLAGAVIGLGIGFLALWLVQRLLISRARPA